MTRLVPLFVLAATLFGCFDPDEETPPPSTEAQAGACMPDGDLCSENPDCCAFDGTLQSGAGLCVDMGDVAECTSVCYADGDCATGCCAALVDNTDYGACGPCSADPFVRGGGSMPSCGDAGTYSVPVNDEQCQCLPGYAWCSDAPDDFTCCEA